MALGFYQTNINGHAGDRPWRRHRRLPQRPAPVPRQERRHLRVVQQRRARRARHSRCAPHCSRVSPTAISPRIPTRSRRSVAAGAKEDAQKLAGVYSTTRGARSNFLAIADLIGQTKVGVDKDGNRSSPRRKGLSGQPRQMDAHRADAVARRRTAMTCCGAKVADGKADRFSFGSWRRSSISTARPWYRSSAWILPLLYCVACGPAADWPAVADAGCSCAGKFKGDARPRRASALDLPLEPDRGIGHPCRARLGGSWSSRCCSATSASGGEHERHPDLCCRC